MSESQPMADGGDRPDCCGHFSQDMYGCTDCLNTGHAHDPADPCPPERSVTS